MWQQTEINNMLKLTVANQQRNDLTAQQVLPAIVEGLSGVKLLMEANISFVPAERVTHFGRQQRHQGRQPQTFTKTRSSTSTQRGQCGNDEAGPSTFTQQICTPLPKPGHQHLPVMSKPPLVSIIQLMSTSTACLYINRLDYPLP